jgi:hypothetical protein
MNEGTTRSIEQAVTLHKDCELGRKRTWRVDGGWWLERGERWRTRAKWVFRECVLDGVTRSKVNTQCCASGEWMKGILDERRGVSDLN